MLVQCFVDLQLDLIVSRLLVDSGQATEINEAYKGQSRWLTSRISRRASSFCASRLHLWRVPADTSSFTLPFVHVVILVAIAAPVSERFALAGGWVVVPSHKHGSTYPGSLW